MKALIWKEYRQNLRLLIGVSGILLLPYIVIFGNRLTGRPIANGWHETISMANSISLLLTVLIGSLFGACAVAGDRGERSSQFIAYLPISRGKRLASKIIVTVGICLLFWLANSVIAYFNVLMASGQPNQHLEPSFFQRTDEAFMFISAAVFLYGTAWLVGNLVDNTAIAVGISLANLITIMLVYGQWVAPTISSRTEGQAYVAVLAGGGLACFLAGAWIYMRRLEP